MQSFIRTVASRLRGPGEHRASNIALRDRNGRRPALASSCASGLSVAHREERPWPAAASPVSPRPSSNASVLAEPDAAETLTMTNKDGCARPVPVTASVPGRVCLAGESLDWMIGGPSVTAAIPLRTRVTVWRAPGSVDVVLSSSAPIYRTRLLPAATVARRHYMGEVLDHMQAAARVTLNDDRHLAGLVITASTESPVAAGVASSAAVTLAACAALSQLDGMPWPDLAGLCKLAYQVESDELSIGAGWMDYLACAHGGVNAIDSATPPGLTRIADTLGMPLVLIDTLERRSTKSVLAAKRAQLVARDPAMLTYVARTAELAATIASELAAADVDYPAVGRWLNTAQDLLARQARCSTPLIDTCIGRALAAGAYGAKLTGSGHGGCLFALVPPDATTTVLAALEDLPVHTQAIPACEPAGLTTRPADLGLGSIRP